MMIYLFMTLLVIVPLAMHMDACNLHVEAVDNMSHEADRERQREPFYRYCKLMSWPLRLF